MILTAVDRPIGYTMNPLFSTERLEPVSLDQVKAHLRYPSAAEDVLLTTYLAAARSYLEEQTGRQCLDAIWEYAIDGAPYRSVLELPRPPLASIVSVTYDDADGAAQTLDADTYRVIPSYVASAGSPSDPMLFDPHCPPGRIELASGASWPTTSGLGGTLRIRRVCGYGATQEAMPPLLQQTLFLIVAHFHTNRQEFTDSALHPLPLSAQSFINAFKYSALPTLPLTRSLSGSLLGDRYPY